MCHISKENVQRELHYERNFFIGRRKFLAERVVATFPYKCSWFDSVSSAYLLITLRNKMFVKHVNQHNERAMKCSTSNEQLFQACNSKFLISVM